MFTDIEWLILLDGLKAKSDKDEAAFVAMVTSHFVDKKDAYDWLDAKNVEICNLLDKLKRIENGIEN